VILLLVLAALVLLFAGLLLFSLTTVASENDDRAELEALKRIYER
jgi:hypothetical protein